MKSFIYEAFESLQSTVVGPLMRKLGKNLYAVGTKIEGIEASEDRLVPSLRKLVHSNHQPNIQLTNFVAPNATILGQVQVGQNSSIWYGATLIGTAGIKIGSNTIIQDRAHLSRKTTIGNNVFVGPNVILQGSTLRNRAFIGMGSTIRHAVVEQEGCVAAGTVIPDNAVVKEGEIWAGNPGKFLRNITPIEREIIRQHLNQMIDLAAIHSQQTQKTVRQVISGSKQPYQYLNIDDMVDNLEDYPFSYTQNDEQFAQKRVFMREKLQFAGMGTDYQPYDYDNSHLNEKFRVGIHEEELKKVATKLKSKQAFESDTNPWKSAF